MKYFLRKDVFWVRGALNSCLYDFNKNKLYWLNRDTTLFLREVLDTDKPFFNEARKILSKFKDAEIVTEDNHNASLDSIESILIANKKIDFCWIELTDKCNLKCIHCYNNSDMEHYHSLTLAELKNLVNELVRFGIKTVQLIGGEPLLIKTATFFEMVDYVANRFEDFEIFCNGTLLNETIIKKFTQYPNIRVAVSLYSFIESEHDKITRVAGSQKKTLNAINLLKQYNIPVRYVGVYVDGLDVGQHEEHGQHYKQDYIRLTGRANLNLYNKKLLEEKIISLDSFTSYFTKERILKLYKNRCFSNYLYISSNLDVFPCVMERRIKHGNLRTEKLADIIKNSILNHSKNDVEECKECEFRYICKDCRPDSLNGKFNAKPWYCTYDVYSGKWADCNKFIGQLNERIFDKECC